MAAQSVLSGPVVCIIDDEPIMCECISMLLSAEGIRSRTYTSGPSFLADGFSPDIGCILMDIRMPGLNGHDLYKHVSSWPTAPPVIVMSGTDNPIAPELPFLLKPFSPDVLVALVRSKLSHHLKVSAPQWQNRPAPADISDALLGILDSALYATQATRGNIQVFNPALGGLEIRAHRGFSEPFLKLFRLVRPDDPSACGRAFRSGHRVIVPDVYSDPEFAPFLPMARQAGFRAVQSTPIRADGQVVGVLSTHFSNPANISPVVARVLDELCVQAAALISPRVDRRL